MVVVKNPSSTSLHLPGIPVTTLSLSISINLMKIDNLGDAKVRLFICPHGTCLTITSLSSFTPSPHLSPSRYIKVRLVSITKHAIWRDEITLETEANKIFYETIFLPCDCWLSLKHIIAF
ncbi:hypothetical protein PHYBLDRAFT_165113 [Phycomyces blakesleeanus NRRL 1555(-)]|uniref:Uncharacterized protein n=1 Tax=Phycomyces blakesleeanus (strain ATCC 8743b / DSM 1359 / FGSC 10004 / NBRC 33097 / NRRL 1555) TaxID=763407 RepID=A0A167NTQ7_PHYB8|nr:hypothetical protein PHYBLDRAFT_165113 [Phycomyces blakesleeanus NRRL 1555(-)]OAD76586.1 hypothetical protein PHYBLDRAFT_165113 [Phycomyces blakesleeanus NRRL 1555(-)]|eukprot:XP_018294626.1 hypothetical protein PHYBLDRAFT_165113 [Phycomyces blakesleeanus NRRL 1555(-)]